jgi:hypothetical protein
VIDPETKAIMWAAIEGDAGLWEAAWELNTLFPEHAPSENRRRAEAIIRRLLGKGWVRLFRWREPLESCTALSPAEHNQALRESSNWEPPEPHGLSICFDATPRGKQESGLFR